MLDSVKFFSFAFFLAALMGVASLSASAVREEREEKERYLKQKQAAEDDWKQQQAAEGAKRKLYWDKRVAEFTDKNITKRYVEQRQKTKLEEKEWQAAGHYSAEEVKAEAAKNEYEDKATELWFQDEDAE